MLKKEISGFLLDFGEQKNLSTSLPSSVLSTLISHGASAVGTESEARFFTTLSFGENKGRRTVLRISGLSSGAAVYFSGNEIKRANSLDSALYDISDLVGTENGLLEVIYRGGCDEILKKRLPDKIELLSFEGAIIDRISVTQSFEDTGVQLSIKAELYGKSESMRAVATLVSSAGQVYYAGLTRGRGQITVKDPLLWWPRGLGLQSLYRLTVNLYGDSEIEDTRELKIGFCKLSTASPLDGATLEVGGVEFLPMGSVYEHVFDPSPITERKRCEWIVSSARNAGYNTLVIPCNTPLLPDYFYDACDVSGIVVIHELSSVDEQAKRLLLERGHHASFGILDLIGLDALDEACEELRAILPELDFAHYDEREGYPSFSILPSRRTIDKLVPKEEQNPFSRTLDTLAGGYVGELLRDISRENLYPRDLSSLAYLSQLEASRGLKENMIKRRLARGEAGRAVFSSISSNKSFASDSLIDSEAVWTAPYFASAKFFSPTLVYAERRGACVSFFISNERRLAFIGELEYRVISSKNELIFRGKEDVAITEMSARKLFERDLAEYVEGHENEYYLEYTLREGASIIYRDTLLFASNKDFKFENPEIKAEIVGDEHRFSMTLSATALAKDVQIEFPDSSVTLNENYIDLTSGHPVKISVNTIGTLESAEHLYSSLRITSLYDVK